MAKGTAIIDFGAYPGSNLASVVVSGQAGILADSGTDAWLAALASTDHTLSDHNFAAMLLGLSTGSIVPGTGFTIYAACAEKMQGTFNLQWAWA